MATDITKKSTDVIDTDWLMNAMVMSVFMMVVFMAMVPMVIESTRRIPILTEEPEASEYNWGYMFILARPGQRGELRIIARNDANGYESVLIGLTT